MSQIFSSDAMSALAAKKGMNVLGQAATPKEGGFLSGMSAGLQSGFPAMERAITPITAEAGKDTWGRVGQFLGGMYAERSQTGRAVGTGLGWMGARDEGEDPRVKDLLYRIASRGYGSSPWSR